MKKRTPTLRYYLKNDLSSLVGKTFALSKTDATFEIYDLYSRIKDHHLFAGSTWVNGYAGGTTDEEDIDLTQAMEGNYGILNAIELIEGFNAKMTINPVARDLMDRYPLSP